MEAALQAKILSLDLVYLPVETKSINKIHDLFCLDQLSQPVTGIEYYYVGLYHQYITKDYDLMKKSHQAAIEVGYHLSLIDLGDHYQKVERNYEAMKECYLRAIELGDSYFLPISSMISGSQDWTHPDMKNMYRIGDVTAMQYLGDYYRLIEGNIDLMLKYYRMAIELDDPGSMNNLAYYYQAQGETKKMFKYYHQAIERGNNISMYNLAMYYTTTEVNQELMLKYHQMGAQYGNEYSLHTLEKHYLQEEPTREVFEFALTCRSKVLLSHSYLPAYLHDLLQLRSSYLPNKLALIKQKYLHSTFRDLRVSPTWFSPPFCVRDIITMIEAYL